MKKKALLTLMVIALNMLVFGMINVSAETYEDLTYTVVNGEVTITDCVWDATSVYIPERISGYPVTKIGQQAFSYCHKLTSITIPDSIVTLGADVFSGCINLTNVTIGNGVQNIDIGEFHNCPK